VLYVGMTRAKERLYLSSVLRRNAGPLRGPSRFVLGLPERNVKRFNHQ
jgi:superfamily I DNA/RNA helicase